MHLGRWIAWKWVRKKLNQDLCIFFPKCPAAAYWPNTSLERKIKKKGCFEINVSEAA